PAGSALPDDYITMLLATRDGALWIGTVAGLARWRAGELARYPDLSGHVITSLLQDHQGTLWIATQPRRAGAGRLCDVRADALHCEGADGLFGGYVGSLFEDPAGALWMTTAKGVCRRRPGPPQFYPATTLYDSLQSLEAGDHGELLLAMDGRVERMV